MKLKVASTVGQNSTLTVSDAVFGAKFNPNLIAQAIRVYLSNQRQGSSKVKTRSEIARTKKKWFKQKGTGNARHGARTPNIFVGGGVAHGPTGLQNWTLKLPSNMKRAALVSALSKQVDCVMVSDDLNQLDGKTSSAQKMIAKMMPDAHHVLVVLPQASDLVMRSLRNLENVLVTSASRLTTYEVAYADGIILTKEAVKVLEDRLTGPAKTGKTQVAKAEKAVAVEKKAAPVKAPAKKAEPKTAPKKTAEKKTVKKAAK
jgi:large subunit ribosomal protein L4